MNKQTVLIFDFDGTIIDSEQKIFEILIRMAPNFGIKVKDSEINKLKLLPARKLIKELKVPIYKLPFIMSRLRREVSEAIINLKPIKGIPEVLKALHKRGHWMIIVTSNSEENTKLFLKNNKLDYFESIKGGGSLFGKDKELKEIINDKKLLPEKIIYVGDEARDIESARKVGIKIISVSWGFNTKGALEKQNPDWLVTKPEELLLI